MEVVKKLKGISARLIFKKFPHFKQKQFWGGHLWSEGYYAGSAGVVTSEAIAKYIRANSSDHSPRECSDRWYGRFSLPVAVIKSLWRLLSLST